MLSGRTTYVGFASSDDHAVKKLEVFLDNALVAAKDCDNIAYECQLSYKWSIRRVHGQHTATFKSTDWMGNVGTDDDLHRRLTAETACRRSDGGRLSRPPFPYAVEVPV